MAIPWLKAHRVLCGAHEPARNQAGANGSVEKGNDESPQSTTKQVFANL
jgi:hypothetical protein